MKTLSLYPIRPLNRPKHSGSGNAGISGFAVMLIVSLLLGFALGWAF
jgi:hypothetical protein